MINSILEYSRQSLSEQTFEEVDTYELISQTAFLLFPSNNMQIKLKNSLPVITTRKLKLQQVFQNLIGNAIKYIDKKHGLMEVEQKTKGTFTNSMFQITDPAFQKKIMNGFLNYLKLLQINPGRTAALALV